MDQLADIYQQFLNLFPVSIQWLISSVIAIALVVAIIKLLIKNFLIGIVLLILVVVSVPILRITWEIIARVVGR